MRWFILFILCASCRVGPVYEPPNPAVPCGWKAPTVQPEEPPDLKNWWELFGDETLNDLEQQAILNNPQLDLALARLAEARGLAGVAFSELFPQLSLYPSYSNTGTLFKLYGVPTGVVPGVKPIIRVHELSYYLPATLSYELDLWGKFRSLWLSAEADVQSKEAAYGVALLSLTSDLASYYFNLRTLDAQIAFLQQTIKLRRDSLRFNSGRYRSGIANAIDVSSAELELSNTEAQYQNSIRQRNQFENAIATLLAIPASDFCLCPRPLVGDPPLVPAGLPSSILHQRPDIVEAERTMAEQHALINVAIADYFPDVKLTGTLGYYSPDLKQFLKWISRYWSWGVDVRQYLFDAGRKDSVVDITWALFNEAEASYKQVVLTAFQEVEDALNDLEWEAKQHASLQRSVQSANRTFKLANQRYRNGIATYDEVVVFERSVVDAELNAIGVQGQRFQASIQLIKALGGGWSDPCFQDTEVACAEL